MYKKNKPFVPRDKNDQTCTTALYISVCSKCAQSQCLRSDTFAQ